jgi:hypothetical protein
VLRTQKQANNEALSEEKFNQKDIICPVGKSGQRFNGQTWTFGF